MVNGSQGKGNKPQAAWWVPAGASSPGETAPRAASRFPAPEGKRDGARPYGRLKIFLSYAAGTGKTLAMLEDAYRRLQEGVDVVAGFVEAHGHGLETELLERFEVLPPRQISGSGISYQTVDLDAVLARHPQLVLIDQMARVNPPGLRHEARYLEIDELLNAGIDVYTTLNLYQVESYIDTIAYLTGFTVDDTVPDHFLDNADQMEMVDFPPQRLLERYQTHQIFMPPRAEQQLAKIFQPSHLFALRELTLRYVARRSNEFMRSYLKDQGLSETEVSSERLLVCVSDSQNAGQVVRAGRRMADETRAEWTVIYVETPAQSADWQERQATVAQHLKLAEMLGAQTETVTGRSVVEAVREYAQKNHIRRIMIGSSKLRPWLRMLGRVSMAERLLREDPTMSVYVVGSDYTPQPFQMPPFLRWLSRLQLLGSLFMVAIPTLLGLALSPTVISRSANLVMLYLLAVMIASITLGLVPALLTAVLSVLAFDFFFVPPIYRLAPFSAENAITFIGLLGLSIIISTLVTRERMLTRAAQRRAEQVTQLYELSRDLATAVDLPQVYDTVLQHVRTTFDREAVILLSKNGELLLSASSAGQSLESSELTAAEWAFQQGRPAGYNTGTFSYASFRYFPLETGQGIIGVMGVRLAGQNSELDPEQMRQLGVYVTKAASSIERALFAEQASQAEILRATEKLQTALLNSISHDLRTPLASITGVLSSLRLDDDLIDANTRHELVETAFGEAERLNRLVGNLLDMTRLESGTLKISLQPCDVQDVIGSALNALATRLEDHPVQVDIAANLPLVPIDFVLINQVLINLLDNAAKYSPETGPIEIRALPHEDFLEIDIEDSGPGIPHEDLERIFEKFYRVKRFEHVVGTGLGLSICKGIIEAHGGKIWAENRPEGGGKFVFTLPYQSPRLATQEPEVQPLQERI